MTLRADIKQETSVKRGEKIQKEAAGVVITASAMRGLRE